jgi:2'-hydroxyisoflavone reductase
MSSFRIKRLCFTFFVFIFGMTTSCRAYENNSQDKIRPKTKLNVLVLGGTRFLGRHLVEEFLKRGHKVTLFNRAVSNPNLFSNLEKIKGDRGGDNLKALMGRKWDAVIDTSGYIPRIVELSSNILCNSTSHYTFISTISVYEDFNIDDIDENSSLAKLEDPKNENITDKTYGPLKGLCESVVQSYFPKKALIIRPGIIVGPYDTSDRFTYWVDRVNKGGKVLAPPNQSLQFIDVRDLSKWIVEMVEKQKTGIYNATGETIDFKYLFQECQKVSGNKADVIWVNEDFLLKKDVKGWAELPFWVPKAWKISGVFTINSQKAIKEGLKFRRLVETISSTLKWHLERNSNQLKVGLDDVKEKELLLDWEKEK